MNNTLIIIDCKDKYLLDIHDISYAEMNISLVEKKNSTIGDDESKANMEKKKNYDKHLYNFKSSKTKWRYIFLIHFVSVLFISIIYIDQKTLFVKKYFDNYGTSRREVKILPYYGDDESGEESIDFKPKRNVKNIVLLNPKNVNEDSLKTNKDSSLIDSKYERSIMNSDSIKIIN